jgi:hypothetical protein
MTTLLDYRSRYVVGAIWCVNGSSHSIKQALLQGFTRYGLPDRFYCDNGKDYVKIAGRSHAQRDPEIAAAGRAACREVGDLSTGVLQRLGIPVTFCLPRHPQSKHVERYHRIVHERFDMAFPTYTAGATHLRPDNTTAALKQHGQLLRMGRPSESQLPLASEFIRMCAGWIEGWYHQQPQDGAGMDGRTPAEVFEAEQAGRAFRACPGDAELAMLLCERTTLKVSNCQIKLDGDAFVPDLADHYANFQMHELSGTRVTVAYNPLDPMFAAVLDEDGHFVCRLQRKDLVRFAPDDKETREKVGAFLANRNGLRKAVRDSIADVGRRVQSAGGFTTLAEQHRQRADALLPRAVNDGIADLTVQPARRPIEDASFEGGMHSKDVVRNFFERLGGVNGAQG